MLKKLILAVALSIAAVCVQAQGVEMYRDYETVAASQTDQVLGTTGTVGDVLDKLVISVATAATSTVSIKDGSGGGAIVITAANTPIGVYTVLLGARSTGAGGWRVTTGAGATAVAVGRFR